MKVWCRCRKRPSLSTKPNQTGLRLGTGMFRPLTVVIWSTSGQKFEVANAVAASFFKIDHG